jgi:hypothetical protein
MAIGFELKTLEGAGEPQRWPACGRWYVIVDVRLMPTDRDGSPRPTGNAGVSALV